MKKMPTCWHHRGRFKFVTGTKCNNACIRAIYGIFHITRICNIAFNELNLWAIFKLLNCVVWSIQQSNRKT